MTRVFSVCTLLILSLLSPPLLANDYKHNFPDDESAVNYLLGEIEKSEVTFIRNGDEYSATKAKEHLAYKMKMARKMFWFFGPSRKITVKEFIERIASKSSSSGKVYKVRLKDGTVMNTGDWLRQILSQKVSKK